MDPLVELVKTYLLPGSASFLLLGATAALALSLLGEAHRRWGRRIGAALVVFYWIISLPVTSMMLENTLANGYGPLRDPAAAGGARTLVVLGGGAVARSYAGRTVTLLSTPSAARALEAARLYHMLEIDQVIASGGGAEEGAPGSESEALREAMIELGIPSEKIRLESESESTHDQAERLKPLLETMGVRRFVLITSRTHMRRALAVFEAQGLDARPSAAPEGTMSDAQGLSTFLPSPSSLNASQAAFRELLALAYYTARGWLRTP